MMGLMQMVMLPLIFLSGALYPITNLPGWLNFLVKINPITYAVHLIRTTVFEHISVTPAAMAQLNPPLTWFGWVVPPLVQAGVVVVTGLIFFGIAVLEFNHAD
jgi:ABC-2 type transport system permease protein